MSQTAGRALRLLELAAQAEYPLTMMEFVSQSGIDKSTCLRTLRFLEAGGYLTREVGTRRYRGGPTLLALAAAALRSVDLGRLIRPYLDQFRDETGETAALHLRLRDQRVCIDGAESHQDVRRVVPLGESHPLVSGPAGKVILAFLDASEVDSLLTSGLDELSRERVQSQLGEIRARGYMLAISDRTFGVAALAAPLFAAAEPLASVTIAGPAERWTTARMRAFAPKLTDALAAVSEHLGAVRQVAKVPRSSGF